MLPKIPQSPDHSRTASAFTIMEILVVVAIILVLAAIALPVYSSMRSRGNKAVAMNNMRQVTAALISYAGQNDGDFPMENLATGDSWSNTANPGSEKVWYNALPRMSGHKGVGDYATSPREYYTKDNLLFIPGAQYPASDKKLVQPLFAYAINTKLQRKDATSGVKAKAKLSQITLPSRTVAFLETGLPGEPKASSVQPRYEGEAKSGGRSFVERYGGQGIITFLDGHAESFAVKDILTETGKLIFPQTNIVWTRTPEEDPNAGPVTP